MWKRSGRGPADLGRIRPPVAGLGLVAFEGLLALVGLRWSVLSGLTLVLAPGLAILPLLPRELGPLERRLSVPVVGLAAVSLAIICVSSIGIPLTGITVRLLLGAMALAGIAAERRIGSEQGVGVSDQPFWRDRARVGTAVGLAAVICLAVALQGRVIAGNPVPGEDWGSYLLYPFEIARQHAMLIDNPYWMLGGHPFSSDPGVASIYGAFLIMSGASATVLAHGIWVFALLSIVSVFVMTSSLWGSGPGLVAAGLYAVIPLNHNMIAWHGLANMYALCLLPFALLAAGWALRGRGTPRWSALMALMLVALLAAHRLTFTLTVLAIVLIAAAGFATTRDRGPLLRFALRTLGCSAVLLALVAIDLVSRSHEAGGVQSYKQYLATKVLFDLTVSDLTLPVAVAGALAIVAVAARLRSDLAYLVPAGLAAAVVVLGYGWIVHVPTVYYRMVYFLPLAMAPAIGIVLFWFARARLGPIRKRVAPAAVAAAAALVLIAATGSVAHDRGPVVRSFYAWASTASVRGLDEIQRHAGPDDMVVADRCWSFLSPWLLRRPVLAGLDPADILPHWEAKPAAEARTILHGRPAAARRMADRKRARYALINPGCASDETENLRLPSIGAPIYESTRLVVLDLSVRTPTDGGAERRQALPRQQRVQPRGQGTGPR